MSELHFNGNFTSSLRHCSLRVRIVLSHIYSQTAKLLICNPLHLSCCPAPHPLHISNTRCTSWFYSSVYRFKSLQIWHQSFTAWLVHVSPHSYCYLILVLCFHAPFEPYAISCSHFMLPSHILYYERSTIAYIWVSMQSDNKRGGRLFELVDEKEQGY